MSFSSPPPPRDIPEFKAELEFIDSWLSVELKHELYELLDAELPARVYSNPPEWAHRVHLDCVRLVHWFREHPGRPWMMPENVTPYWARLAELVAQRLERR